jgi:hypothetical protein
MKRHFHALSVALLAMACDGATPPSVTCGEGTTLVDGACVVTCDPAACPSGACADDGRCVECVTDAHCPAEAPRCAVDRCVACVPGGDECAAGTACDPVTLTCVDASCVPERCPSGACAASGQCAECASDGDCPSGRTCVDQVCRGCVGGEACPGGTYCDEASDACVRGCAADDACTSGECASTHDCVGCVDDGECAGGRLCVAGSCVEGCSTERPCEEGLACCGGVCRSVLEQEHCGGCGRACTTDQLCDGTCQDFALTSVCRLSPRIVRSGDPEDDAASDLIAAALPGCDPPLTLTTVRHDDPGVLAPDGRPLAAPGTLNVLVGRLHPAVDYLVHDAGVTLVHETPHDTSAGALVYRLRRTGARQLDVTPDRGFFIVQLVREPIDGSVNLLVHGLSDRGTRGGAWYVANRVIPFRGAFTGTYYVVEYVDQDGDEVPEPSDLYNLYIND